jgi:hypothetical protein
MRVSWTERLPIQPRRNIAVGLLAALAAMGCVERTVRIQSDPPGAVVVVNDEEVGVTPAKFSFLWYGDYEVILRKAGYETLKTNYRLDPPWYQIPPLDLITETLVPGTIHDDHVVPTYPLRPAETPHIGELVDRAVEMRERTLLGGGAQP